MGCRPGVKKVASGLHPRWVVRAVKCRKSNAQNCFLKNGFDVLNAEGWGWRLETLRKTVRMA